MPKVNLGHGDEAKTRAMGCIFASKLSVEPDAE